MITKRTIKLVNSLADARDRRETGLFVAEGTKCVLDVLPHFTCRYLFAEESWLDANAAAIPAAAEVVPATRGELRMMTRLMATPPVRSAAGGRCGLGAPRPFACRGSRPGSGSGESRNDNPHMRLDGRRNHCCFT